MAYKVFLRGNLLIVVDTTTNEEMEAIASQVMIHRDYTTSTSWRFKNLNGNIPDLVPESEIVDDLRDLILALL